MKKKKKKVSVKTLAEKVRRENEIKEYGRILSLRPSIIHKDKTKYNRKTKHKEINNVNYEQFRTED